MNYRVEDITSEHALNKAITQAKKDKQRLDVLFVSEWDPVSTHIVEMLNNDDDSDNVLYVVNSWDTPHAFQIWNVSHAPTLVRVDPYGRGDKGQSVKKSSHVSEILHMLRLENLRPKMKKKA